MQSGPLMRPTLPFLARGGFRILLLKTLSEKPMYGYEVMKALETRFQGFYRPSAGAVYPALRSLQREGLVTVTGSERRKTYRVTTKGKASIRSHRAEMEKYFQSLQAAVGPERAALLRELRDMGKLLAMNLRSLTPRQAVQLRSAVAEMRKRVVTILGESVEGGSP